MENHQSVEYYGGEGDAIKNGQTGYYVNGNDLNALYDTLLKILKMNHYKELGLML